MATARLRPVDRLAGKCIHDILRADQADQPLDKLIHLVFGQAAVLAQRKGHIFAHAQRIEERAILKDHGDALANGAHALFIEVGDLLAFDVDGAGVGLEKTHQQAQRDRFAHAAAAQDAERLAARPPKN